MVTVSDAPVVTDRRNVTSGTKWEDQFGYSRAVRKGDVVKVSATAAVDDGEVVGPDDPYEQARYILETIASALEEVDASMTDVVQTRIYVTEFENWEAIGRAHREFFGDVKPANTLLEVDGLPLEDLLLEIEAEAIVG